MVSVFRDGAFYSTVCTITLFSRFRVQEHAPDDRRVSMIVTCDMSFDLIKKFYPSRARVDRYIDTLPQLKHGKTR
jgi:hypothetical protein